MSVNNPEQSAADVDAASQAAAPVAFVPDGREGELADQLMGVIVRKMEAADSEGARAYVELGLRLIEAFGTRNAREQAEVERRHAGMWLGAIMSTVFVACGVYFGLSEKNPALLSLLLICLGAACAGATFAVITGHGVRADEFADAVVALIKTPDKTARREEGK